MQHGALHRVHTCHPGGQGDLGVLVHLVDGAGDDPGAVHGKVQCLENGGIIALQNGLLQRVAPGPDLVKVPAKVHIGLFGLQYLGRDILPLDGLERRLVARQEGALPGDVAGDVGGRLVVQLAHDLIHVLGAGDGGLGADAADDVVARVERTGNAAGRAVFAIGVHGARREAVAHVAAAVLNTGDAAHVIGRFQLGIHIAVFHMADDGALALLHLSGNTAAGMGVGQVIHPHMARDHAAGDGAVRDAGNAAHVLLAADLTVEHGHVLHVGLVIFVAHVAEQAHILFGIVDGQVADGMEPAVEGAQVSLLLFGGNGLEALPAGHIDISRQDIVTVPGRALFPGAGQIHQLGRRADLIDVLRGVVNRRHGVPRPLCRRGNHQQRGKHRQRQEQTEKLFSDLGSRSAAHKNAPF